MIVTLPALHPVQDEVAAHPARMKVLAAGRRWGKTILGVDACLETGLQGGRTWWVSKSYKTGQEGWLYLVEVSVQIPGADPRTSDRVLMLPGGGTVEVRTAEEPGGLRGAGLDGVVFDECAYSRESAWTNELRPALSDRRGWALFISSPNGKNWFHRLYERAATLKGWARWQYPSWTNPYLDREDLEQARAELSADVFAQEYGAQFLDLALVRPFRPEWFLLWSEQPPLDRLYTTIAVDPAISKRDTACQTAIVVAGVPLHGIQRTTAYVLHADAGHWSPYETADRLLTLAKTWRARTLRIEDVAYQRALGDILEREAALRGLRLPSVDLVKPEMDKLRRALRVSPLVESGRVLFGPGQAHLMHALCAVPEDDTGWDLTDAFGLAITGLPMQRAAAHRLEEADTISSRERTRAEGYAVKVGAVDPSEVILSHQGPTPHWRGGWGAREKARAASYAMTFGGGT